MTTQKSQNCNSARDLKDLRILLENSARGLGSWRECCCGYASVFENTPEKLMLPKLAFQGRAQLEYSNHIAEVGIKATCQHLKPSHILKETMEPIDPL